jgi:hypothetical protein
MSLYKLIRVEPSLYEYVSFNIRTYYCVHERLIYYSIRDRIEFNRIKPSRVHKVAELILHPLRPDKDPKR